MLVAWCTCAGHGVTRGAIARRRATSRSGREQLRATALVVARSASRWSCARTARRSRRRPIRRRPTTRGPSGTSCRCFSCSSISRAAGDGRRARRAARCVGGLLCSRCRGADGGDGARASSARCFAGAARRSGAGAARRRAQRDLPARRARADAEARRALALAGGVPPAGGIAVFDNDPLERARKLFAERCAGCHVLDGAGEARGRSSTAGRRAPGCPTSCSSPTRRASTARPGCRHEAGQGRGDELTALVEWIYAQGGGSVDAALAAGAPPSSSTRLRRLPRDRRQVRRRDGAPNFAGRASADWLERLIRDAGAACSSATTTRCRGSAPTSSATTTSRR